VSKESGGNPRAYNPVSVGGQHAEGAWQMLPSTFAAYSRGGSIWNPIAEGIAAIDYIQAVYGSPSAIPGLLGGTYVGYAGGTASAAPGWAWVGEHGRELVRFRGGEQVYPRPAVPAGGRGGAVRVVLEVRSSGSESDEFLARMIRRYVHVKAAGDVAAAFGS
jgi:SLT domain-containing protein